MSIAFSTDKTTPKIPAPARMGTFLNGVFLKEGVHAQTRGSDRSSLPRIGIGGI